MALVAGLEAPAADPQVHLEEVGAVGEGAARAGGIVAAAVGDERGRPAGGAQGKGVQGAAALGSRTGWRGETAMAPLAMASSVSSSASR